MFLVFILFNGYFYFYFLSFGLESVHLKEENITLDNNAYKATAHQSYQRDKQKLMEAKEKVAKEISGDAVLASVKYERGMDSVIHVNAFSEAKQQPESNNKQLKRKGKSLASKVSIDS